MLLKKPKSVTTQIKKLLKKYPKQVVNTAVTEWQKRLQFKSLREQVYFLGRYRLINPALVAVIFQVSLNQAHDAIALLQKAGCLKEQKGQFRSVLACRVLLAKVPISSEIEFKAEKRWEKRPSSNPLKLKLRDIIRVA